MGGLIGISSFDSRVARASETCACIVKSFSWRKERRLIHALWDIRAAGARGLAHLGLHQPVKRAHPHHHLPHGRHAEPQPELSRVFPAALPGLKRVGPGGEYHPRRGVGHALPAQQRAPPAAREVAAVGAGRRSRRRVRRELGLGIGARRAAAGPSAAPR